MSYDYATNLWVLAHRIGKLATICHREICLGKDLACFLEPDEELITANLHAEGMERAVEGPKRSLESELRGRRLCVYKYGQRLPRN
jgi:hypothetical protein